MTFSIDDLRGLSTVFCLIAFAAVVFWAYGPSRKQYFDKAAALPFEDETDTEKQGSGKQGSGKQGSGKQGSGKQVSGRVQQ